MFIINAFLRNRFIYLEMPSECPEYRWLLSFWYSNRISFWHSLHLIENISFSPCIFCSFFNFLFFSLLFYFLFFLLLFLSFLIYFIFDLLYFYIYFNYFCILLNWKPMLYLLSKSWINISIHPLNEEVMSDSPVSFKPFSGQ